MKTMKAVSLICKPAALALLFALGGCGGLLRTDYEPPAASVPAAWSHAPAADAQAALLAEGGAWWRNFNDPVLTGLVEGALARNNDLAAAAIRVRRAQYQAGLSEDQLFPQLGGSANVTRTRTLSGERLTTRNNTAELTVSYEVDLWGKLSRQRDAAQWEALATEQDRQSAALSLVGTTATLYWQTAFINQRIASSEESIAYARKTQDLVRAQYAAGGASALEMAEAEQTVASQQAAHARTRWPSCSTARRSAPWRIRRVCRGIRCPTPAPAFPPNCWAAAPTCAPPNSACGKPWPPSTRPAPASIRP
jgi:outer membrane protein TolC